MLALPFLRAWMRLTFALGARRELRGISVSVYGARDQIPEVLDRLDRALALIEAHDPRRLRRLRTDLPRILVGGAETTHDATYMAFANCVVITTRYATAPDLPVERLALLLVHEATHARIAHRGLTYAVGARGRMEVMCVNQELEFAKRLPASADLVSELGSRLEGLSRAGEAPWSDARFDADFARGARDNRLPEWLVRILARTRGHRAA
jgi:hypothetical protein